MSHSSEEMLILHHALSITNNHADTLQEVLDELTQTPLTEHELGQLNKLRCRLLDQFAYRYTRLQDDMGNKLFPACLMVLGENVKEMAAIDRFNRLEQLGWLVSTDQWMELRKTRNEFSHDYPEALAIRYARISLAIEAADKLIVIFNQFKQHILQRFPPQ